MKRITACMVLLLGSVSWGERELFIKSKDTKVLEKPSFTAAVLKTLQPGAAVTWKGADPKEKTLHKVVVDGKEGYVLQANLTPSKPSDERLTSDGQPISAHALASSGAATKALTPAALSYAKEKGPSAQEAAAEVIYLEEHNKNKGTPKLIAEHNKAAGLPGGEK